MSDDSREARTLPLRGFAKMKAEGRGEEIQRISRLGGKAAHAAGTAHEFNSVTGKKAAQLATEKRQQTAIERGETDASAPTTSREA